MNQTERLASRIDRCIKQVFTAVSNAFMMLYIVVRNLKKPSMFKYVRFHSSCKLSAAHVRHSWSIKFARPTQTTFQVPCSDKESKVYVLQANGKCNETILEKDALRSWAQNYKQSKHLATQSNPRNLSQNQWRWMLNQSEIEWVSREKRNQCRKEIVIKALCASLWNHRIHIRNPTTQKGTICPPSFWPAISLRRI